MSGFRSIVIESPCKLSYKGGYMAVRKEDDTAKVHLSEFQTLVLHTNQVYISAYLLSELAKAKVPWLSPTSGTIPWASICHSMVLTTRALASRSSLSGGQW